MATDDDIPIWDDPDVQRICDWRDGRPFPRFVEFNEDPDRNVLVREFVHADQAAGSNGPAVAFIEACLAGIRAVEGLNGQVEAGWIKFFLYFVEVNNSFLWDRHRTSDESAAIGEWVVRTIERHGWGPDGNTTALGQRHSNAMAVAAMAGGGTHRNPATGRMEYGDGSEAKRMAGVVAQPEVPMPEASELLGTTESGAFEAESPSPDAWGAFAETMHAAESGDEASRLILEGAAADAGGDQPRALELFEQAARLGEAQGMYQAALLYEACDDLQIARFWFEAAAAAGHAKGYSWLAQLADREGDGNAEREWTRRGADAGEPWCMGNLAYFLLMDARQAVQNGLKEDVVLPLLRESLDFAVRAANLGQVTAMYGAGMASVFLDRRRDALEWFTRAEQSGHPGARQKIDEFGLR